MTKNNTKKPQEQCQQLLALGGISIIFSNNETDSEVQLMTFSLLMAQLARGRWDKALVSPPARSKEATNPTEYWIAPSPSVPPCLLQSGGDEKAGMSMSQQILKRMVPKGSVLQARLRDGEHCCVFCVLYLLEETHKLPLSFQRTWPSLAHQMSASHQSSDFGRRVWTNFACRL